MQQVVINDLPLALEMLPHQDAPAQIIWLHGWGQSHAALLPLAQGLKALGTHYVLDLPGFGASPRPQETWDVAAYAQHLAAWIRTLPAGPKIIVGHSFGCRVAMRLAALYPDLAKALFLIAAPGLPRERSFWQSLQFHARVRVYKIAKSILKRLSINTHNLAQKFGSRDYKNAGAMRDIFLRIVGDDVRDAAPKITCPVCLLYGENDDETPPDIGVRLAAMIPQARLIVLPDQDHYTVLSTAQHQTVLQIKQFVQSIKGI